MPPYLIDAQDRALFKQCRRAWDLGARVRHNLEPATRDRSPTVATAIAEALSVYYFPGMWEWNRDVVQPLVHQALDRAAPGPNAGPEGHAVLDRYAAWAPPLDTFVPVRVSTDLEVNVPDPLLSDSDLSTYGGEPVRYATRIDAMVWGPDEQLRLVCHRIGPAPFPPDDVLALDEAALTACWAWTHLMLDDRITAILFNQIRVDGTGRSDFRRTVVPVTPAEVATAGRQLGTEVLDMIDASLVIYPNPSEVNCGSCPFRPPCRVLRAAEEPAALLGAAYRARPEPEGREGRIGGQTWSTNRGARPPFRQ